MSGTRDGLLCCACCQVGSGYGAVMAAVDATGPLMLLSLELSLARTPLRLTCAADCCTLWLAAETIGRACYMLYAEFTGSQTVGEV